MQDHELINGLKGGNQQAFIRLIERYQVPLIRLCKGFLHNEEEARDITQETFIEVFESIRHFRADAKLSTWLYRIAVNKSLNLIRKKKLSRLFISLDFFNAHGKNDPVFSSDNGSEQPGTQIENRERSMQIRHAIDSLPENQRIAFILNKYHDLTYKEIAEVLDISLSSVEALLHRAKLNLQKRLFSLYKKNLI